MSQGREEESRQPVSVAPIVTPEDKIKAIESAYPKLVDLGCYEGSARINWILNKRLTFIEMMKQAHQPATQNLFTIFSMTSIRYYFEAYFLLDFRTKVFPRLYDAGVLSLDSRGRGELLLKEIRAYLSEFEGTVLDPKVLFYQFVHSYNDYFNTLFREICGFQFQSKNPFEYIRLYADKVTHVLSLELEKIRNNQASSSTERPLNRGLYWVMKKRELTDCKEELEGIDLWKMSEKMIFLEDEIFLIDSLLLDDNAFKNKEEKQALLFQAICLIRHEQPTLYQALKRFDAIARFDQLFSMISTEKTFKDVILETIRALENVGSSHDGNTGLIQLPPAVVQAMINFTSCLDSVRKRFPQVSNLQDIHGNRLSYFHRKENTGVVGQGQLVQGEEVCIEKIRSILTSIYRNNQSDSLMQAEWLNTGTSEIQETINNLFDGFPSEMSAIASPSCSLLPQGQMLNATAYLMNFIHFAIYGGRGRFEEDLGISTVVGQQFYIRLGYFLHSAVDNDFSARVMAVVIPEIELMLNRIGEQLPYRDFDYIRTMLHQDQMPLFYKLFFNGNLERFCRVMSGYEKSASGLQLSELASVISSLQLPSSDIEWLALMDTYLDKLTPFMACVVPQRFEDLRLHRDAIQKATQAIDQDMIGKLLSQRLIDFHLSSEALEKIVDFLIEIHLFEKINLERLMSDISYKSLSRLYQPHFEFDYEWHMRFLRSVLSRTKLQAESIAPFLLMFVFSRGWMQDSTENQRESIRFHLMKLLIQSGAGRESEVQDLWLRVESAIDSSLSLDSNDSSVVPAEPDLRCFTDPDFIRNDCVFEMFLRLSRLNSIITLTWSRFYYRMLKSILIYRGLDDFLQCASFADRMEQQAILLMMYQERFIHKIDHVDQLKIVFTMLFNENPLGDPFLSSAGFRVRGSWRDKPIWFTQTRSDCGLFCDIQTYLEVKNLFFLLNKLSDDGNRFSMLFRLFARECLSLFVNNQYSMSFLYPQYLSLDHLSDFFKFMLLNGQDLETHESYALLLSAIISLKPNFQFSVANFDEFCVLVKLKSFKQRSLLKFISDDNRFYVFEGDMLRFFHLLPDLDEEMVLKFIAVIHEASFYKLRVNFRYLNTALNLRNFLYLILLQSSCLDRNKNLILEKSPYTLKYDTPLSPPQLVLSIFQHLDALNSPKLKYIVLKKLIDFDFGIMSEILSSLPAIKQWMLRLEEGLLVDFLKMYEARIIKTFEMRPTEGLLFMAEGVTVQNRSDANFRLAKVFSHHAPALFDFLMQHTFFPPSRPELLEKVSMMAWPQMPYFYGLFPTFDEFSNVARQLQAMGHFDESAINESAYLDFKALCREAKANAALQAAVVTSENEETSSSVTQSSPKRHHGFFPSKTEQEAGTGSRSPSPGATGSQPKN